MSENTNQSDGTYQETGSPQAFGSDTSLLDACDELVGLIAISNSLEGPYNSVEARLGSEADYEAAYLQQNEIINRLEYLAVQITDRCAVSDVEIEGKTDALNALSGVAAWERESLRALCMSIYRDRIEVIKETSLAVSGTRSARVA